MRLLTAHRILIAVFVGFALFFAWVQGQAWRRTGATGAGVAAVLAVAAAGAAALYLRSLGGKRG